MSDTPTKGSSTTNRTKPDWLTCLAFELPKNVYDDVKLRVEQERKQANTCYTLLRKLLPEHITSDFLDSCDDDEKTGRRPCRCGDVTIAMAREILAALGERQH